MYLFLLTVHLYRTHSQKRQHKHLLQRRAEIQRCAGRAYQNETVKGGNKYG
jgi:hypothetical protein